MTKKRKDKEKHTEKDLEQNESKIIEEEKAATEKEEPEEKSTPADEKIAELELQISELKDKLLRKAAEFENYKKRAENDQLNLLNYAAESFILKILPVVDDFERSMQHLDEANDENTIQDGVKLIYDKLIKILDEQGIKKIQSVGEPFNVEYHDAMMQKKDDSVPPHTVLEEIETGYTYKDKVIRHAKVIVSEEQSDSTPDQPVENNQNDSDNEKEQMNE